MQRNMHHLGLPFVIMNALNEDTYILDYLVIGGEVKKRSSDIDWLLLLVW